MEWNDILMICNCNFKLFVYVFIFIFSFVIGTEKPLWGSGQ